MTVPPHEGECRPYRPKGNFVGTLPGPPLRFSPGFHIAGFQPCAAQISAGKQFDREKIFRAHARFVDTFGGSYITAEDGGTNPHDMAIVREETKHVAGLYGLSGDPSPFTARGVFRAILGGRESRFDVPDEVLRAVAAALQHTTGCGAFAWITEDQAVDTLWGRQAAQEGGQQKNVFKKRNGDNLE